MVLHGVVEGTTGVVEHLADLDAAGDHDARAASISYTDKTRRSIVPGWADVTPLPKMIDASEPGGVNCIARKSPLGDVIDIQAKPEFLVEALGPIDVRDRYYPKLLASYP